MTERFHIGEWYGRPFLELDDPTREAFARHRVGGHAMTKAEIDRMIVLEGREASGEITDRERERLDRLRTLLHEQRQHEASCPFRTDSPYPTCAKPGGVCSLQLYTDDHGDVRPVDGERGMLRALCPHRFHQANTVFRHIGERILGDPAPLKVGEVGFLESTGNLDSAAGEDVGRIDMILVKSNVAPDHPRQWTAVEIQAVYFSGREMDIEFRHLIATGGAASRAQAVRRPDYRSSGPKRLMPQLQIKVPTLRRWGKKMAIVVDAPFYRSMGEIRTVPHVSNADIVWFLVDFVARPGRPLRELVVVEEVFTTLESSIEGLTGGVAVSLDVFEARIREKAGP